MIADSNGIRFSTDMIVVLLLFTLAVDVLDLSGIMIGGTIVLFLFLHFAELRFDAGAGLLVLFSLFYFGSVAYYEGLGVDTVIKYALAPWGCYVLSYNLMLRNRTLTVTDFATIVAFGFFIHGMLNLVASIQAFGASFNNNYRWAQDFWQRRIITVTTASLYYTPLTVLAIGAIFFSRRKLVKYLAPPVIVLSLYASLIYQNRTLILACGLVAGLDVLLVMLDEDMPMEKKYLIYGVLAFGALAAVVAFLANVAGIRDAIMESSLMNRMTDSKQDRTTIWISFIFGEAWKYPFGGTKAILYENKPYVHNTWLDVFRRGGFFPFLFLIIFTLRSVFDVMTFKRLGRLSGEDSCVIISMLVGTMLSFMVEPVIEANPYVFYLPILVMGAVNGHNQSIQEILSSLNIIKLTA